jgi:Carboxypeptidase regulatory-like domain
MQIDRIRGVGLVVLVGAVAFGSSCPEPPPKAKSEFYLDEILGEGEVRCGPLRRESELIGGPGAYGQVGRGYRCNNSKIRFIVQDDSRPAQVSTRGGNLIDADLVRPNEDVPGEDTLREHVSAIGALETKVEKMSVLNDGTNGEPGVIRIEGVPADLSLAPQAALLAQPLEGRFTTDYILYPDVPYVEVITSFENDGMQGMEVQAADFVALGGATQSFTEEFGYGDVPLFSGVGFLGGGRGRAVSYAWLCEGDVVVPFIDQGITAPFCGSAVPVGRVRSFARWLVVGDGSLESVTRPALELRAVSYGVVRGVVENSDGSPAAGVNVTALTRSLTDEDARVKNEARTDNAGHFVLTLRAGSYHLVAHVLGAGRSVEIEHTVADGGESDVGVLTLGGRARLEVSTRFFGLDDVELAALPAKLTLIPTGDTQRPSSVLADFSRAGAVAYQVSPDGRFSMDAAPGSYRVWVSRGFEWERFFADVTLIDGATQSVSAELVRAFETPGILGAEMHQHTLGSVDAEVPVPVKVLENAAEGIEIAVSTEHDNIVDFTPHLEAFGLTAVLRAFAGNEVSYQAIGHFNAYPWEIDPNDPFRDIGAAMWWSKNVPQMFADVRAAAQDPILQINHPRSERTGYFASLLLDPTDASRLSRPPPELPSLPDDVYEAWSGDFESVEVNGNLGDASLFTEEGAAELKRRARDEPSSVPTLADYFGLLGAGMKVVAMGNSDTHFLNEGVGYPRNFVFLGTDDPAQVSEARFKEAIRAQRVAVGEGCFVTLAVNDEDKMGMDELAAPDDRVRIVLHAPSFVSVGTLEVYVNGRVQPLAYADETITIEATGSISLALTDPPAPRPALRLDAALTGLPTDRDLVVVVLARDGGGLDPTGAGGVFCYSAPLYVDADQDDAWTPWLADTQEVLPF